MSICTLTCTEYMVPDNRGAGYQTFSRFVSYRHVCTPFYAAYLTTAIDVTAYLTITYADICSFLSSSISEHHGLVALECVIQDTSTAAEDIACDSNLFCTFCNSLISSWGSSLHCTNVHRCDANTVNNYITVFIQMIFTHITQTTAAIYIASDMSAQDRFIIIS